MEVKFLEAQKDWVSGGAKYYYDVSGNIVSWCTNGNLSVYSETGSFTNCRLGDVVKAIKADLEQNGYYS